MYGLRSNEIDLSLLDFIMPKLEGVDVFKEFEELREALHHQYIILTEVVPD